LTACFDNKSQNQVKIKIKIKIKIKVEVEVEVEVKIEVQVEVEVEVEVAGYIAIRFRSLRLQNGLLLRCAAELRRFHGLTCQFRLRVQNWHI
jgi:hypothetical protein